MTKYGNKSDALNLMECLSEEMGGIESYTKLAENTEDATLKKMYEDIVTDEKRHAQMLLAAVNKIAGALLK